MFENNIVVVVVFVVAIFVVVPSFSSFHSLKVLAKRPLDSKGNNTTDTFRLGFKVLLFRVYIDTLNRKTMKKTLREGGRGVFFGGVFNTFLRQQHHHLCRAFVRKHHHHHHHEGGGGRRRRRRLFFAASISSSCLDSRPTSQRRRRRRRRRRRGRR